MRSVDAATETHIQARVIWKIKLAIGSFTQVAIHRFSQAISTCRLTAVIKQS